MPTYSSTWKGGEQYFRCSYGIQGKGKKESVLYSWKGEKTFYVHTKELAHLFYGKYIYI
jgi:hypothetical protein